MAEIYRKYLALAGMSAMHYGPAHIVWDDENFERHHVQWCLDHCDEHRAEDCTDTEHAAVRASLVELLALQDDVRNPEPQGYKDNVNAVPEDYPPPFPMERVV